jgi:NADH:ubiquinone oxidoreductase subunit E
LGNCGQAPIVVVDQQAIGHGTSAKVLDRMAMVIAAEQKDDA